MFIYQARESPLVADVICERPPIEGVFGLTKLSAVHSTRYRNAVSVLGQEERYTVKYTPLPEGAPEGEGVYLTVYPESSPNTDSMSF